MGGPEEVGISKEHLEEVEVGQRDDVLAETVVPSDVLPQASEGIPHHPCVTKTYSKKTMCTMVA